MKLSGVRPSVCLFIHLSAPSFNQAPHTTAAALLLWAWRVGDVDPLLRGRWSAAVMPQHSAQQQMRTVPRCQLT